MKWYTLNNMLITKLMTDSTWKGQLRWRNRFIDKNISYSKLPWEREAYRKQNTLAKSYYRSAVD